MDIKDFDQYLAEIYEDRDDSHFRIGSMLSVLEYEVRMLKQLIYSHLDRHNAEIEKSESAWDELNEIGVLQFLGTNGLINVPVYPIDKIDAFKAKYADDLKQIPKR